LPPEVRVRQGRQGKLLHYYLNFSGAAQTISYPYGDGEDLITGAAVPRGKKFKIGPWDLVIVHER